MLIGLHTLGDKTMSTIVVLLTFAVLILLSIGFLVYIMRDPIE
jgi:hypothetical protein